MERHDSEILPMTMEPVAAVASEVLARPDFLPPPVAPDDEVEAARPLSGKADIQPEACEIGLPSGRFTSGSSR